MLSLSWVIVDAASGNSGDPRISCIVGCHYQCSTFERNHLAPFERISPQMVLGFVWDFAVPMFMPFAVDWEPEESRCGLPAVVHAMCMNIDFCIYSCNGW
jgi:hypothetical protein